MAAENQDLLTGFRVPDSHGAIVAPRGDTGSVRTERNAGNRFGVTVDCELFSACRYIPYLYGLVGTSRNEPRAIGTKSDAANFIGMPGDDPGLLTGLSIPNANRFIGASRGQACAVSTKDDAPNPILMTCERQDFLALDRVPQLDGLVKAC